MPVPLCHMLCKTAVFPEPGNQNEPLSGKKTTNRRAWSAAAALAPQTFKLERRSHLSAASVLRLASRIQGGLEIQTRSGTLYRHTL